MMHAVHTRARARGRSSTRPHDAGAFPVIGAGTQLARARAMSGLRLRCLLVVPFPLAIAACSGDATDDPSDSPDDTSVPSRTTEAPSTPTESDASASDAQRPPPAPAPAPTCAANAKSGEYCGGDKVDDADARTLYQCDGPGPAKVVSVCAHGCFVATGQDDFCRATIAACAKASLLTYGLAPDASDHLRCSGLDAGDISQTIGNAAASAGTHAQDGTSGGKPYCAATDLRVGSLTNAEVRQLLDVLASQGFAAFFRDPGKDGWPSSEARHVHAIYVGVPMKAALRAQVQDWLAGKNGLASHGPYSFYQASPAKKLAIQELFAKKN